MKESWKDIVTSLFFYYEFLTFYIKTPFRAPSQTFFQSQQNKREKAGQVSLPRSPSSFLPTAVRFHTALPVPWPRHQPPPSTAGGKAALMAGTGRDPLQAPSREKAPPAWPCSPLSPRPARAAGPPLPRQPHANSRGAGRSPPATAARALWPVSAEERGQGRGFFFCAQQRPRAASRGPAWLAASLREGASIPSREGAVRVIGSNSCTGHRKSYTMCLSALFLCFSYSY